MEKLLLVLVWACKAFHSPKLILGLRPVEAVQLQSIDRLVKLFFFYQQR